MGGAREERKEGEKKERERRVYSLTNPCGLEVRRVMHQGDSASDVGAAYTGGSTL